MLHSLTSDGSMLGGRRGIARKLTPEHHQLRPRIADFHWRLLKNAAYLALSFCFAYVLQNAFPPTRIYFDCSTMIVPNELETGIPTGGERDFEPTNLSHIVFGIGASIETWKTRNRFNELWWRPGDMRGFVWLDREPEWWPVRSLPYRVSENVSGRGFGGKESVVRLARIVLESYRLGWEGARWFVMGDDDTIFVPENLATVLARFDHREMWYIGARSESVAHNLAHGYEMAYGGGGIVLSVAAAEAVSAAIDGCLAIYPMFHGSDGRVRACMSELGVPFTPHLGFHQLDFRGDAYGLLAAHPVAPLVSLHRLNVLNPLIPTKTRLDSAASVMEAARIDPGQALQQTCCYDPGRRWSFSVSWGYTVQIYPWLVPAYLLEIPLHTFSTLTGSWDGPFVFNTRTVVSNNPCSKPAIFFLDRVVNVSSDRTVSSYQRYVKESEKICPDKNYPNLSIQHVRVFSLKVPLSDWTKAMRRKCCNIKYGRRNDTVDVRLRSCRRHEKINPWTTRNKASDEHPHTTNSRKERLLL